MKPTVLLFDIDGTLVTTGGAGRRAMSRAFDQVCGRADALDGLRFGGMTDWGIVRWGFEKVTGPPEDVQIQALLEVYLSALEDEVGKLRSCVAHPGVEALLDAVSGQRRVAVGLATGNVEAGARTKLARIGLWERFGFGGFGCDHEVRSELLVAGAKRGAALLGEPWRECRVVVIGDTPKDVTAAKEIGALCVAVATGTYSLEELAETDADLVVPDLLDSATLATYLSAG